MKSKYIDWIAENFKLLAMKRLNWKIGKPVKRGILVTIFVGSLLVLSIGDFDRQPEASSSPVMEFLENGPEQQSAVADSNKERSGSWTSGAMIGLPLAL